jgi:hypothetical protein
MMLAEQRGLPDPKREAELLAEIWNGLSPEEAGVACHEIEVPGRLNGSGPARVMTTLIRDGGDVRGLLMVLRWRGRFQETDEAVIRAVGCDIGGALRSDRIVAEAQRKSELDALTGLLNHGAVYQRLDAELERHQPALPGTEQDVVPPTLGATVSMLKEVLAEALLPAVS